MIQDALMSQTSSKRKRNAVIVALCGLVWLAIDMLTKQHFNSFKVGELIGGPYFGIFDFRLVHNTGAAWGMFDTMTYVLGTFSLVVCVLLLVYLFVFAPDSSVLTAISLALVVAGGVGNAIDRFTLGYVVDFIEPIFINFPVFNVADIGVTCGIIMFLIAVFFDGKAHE